MSIDRVNLRIIMMYEFRKDRNKHIKFRKKHLHVFGDLNVFGENAASRF